MPSPAAAAVRPLASPAVFLMALSFINWIGFAGWYGLLNNFTAERAGFGWWETGLTQTVREIPGFLAFTAVFWFLWFREQTVAYVSLLVLAIGIAATGYYPSLAGVLVTTFVMSVGFHYFETVNQSLQLQLLEKSEAPRVMGRIWSAGAAAQFIAYGGLAIAWWAGWTSYTGLYLLIGLACVAMTVAAILLFGRFDGPVEQNKGFVLRRRYGLYYALIFMSGARRQIFMAFAAFLLVKRFGFSLADTALLMLMTAALTTLLAGRLGALVGRIGERNTMLIENLVLIIVFAGYATTASPSVAAALYVIDGVFFTLAIAQRTYFQKIAEPADMASTASVSFTINHIAAVVIPVTFGLLGMGNPSLIFWLGSAIAVVSLALALLVPGDPAPGRETVGRPSLAARPFGAGTGPG
jgi:hypothetical protein